MGVGYEKLDRVTLGKKNVTVCNVPGNHFSSRHTGAVFC